MKHIILVVLLMSAFNICCGSRIVCHEGTCVCSRGRTLTQTREVSTNGSLRLFCNNYWRLWTKRHQFRHSLRLGFCFGLRHSRFLLLNLWCQPIILWSTLLCGSFRPMRRFGFWRRSLMFCFCEHWLCVSTKWRRAIFRCFTTQFLWLYCGGVKFNDNCTKII